MNLHRLAFLFTFTNVFNNVSKRNACLLIKFEWIVNNIWQTCLRVCVLFQQQYFKKPIQQAGTQKMRNLRYEDCFWSCGCIQMKFPNVLLFGLQVSQIYTRWQHISFSDNPEELSVVLKYIVRLIVTFANNK